MTVCYYPPPHFLTSGLLQCTGLLPLVVSKSYTYVSIGNIQVVFDLKCSLFQTHSRRKPFTSGLSLVTLNVGSATQGVPGRVYSVAGVFEQTIHCVHGPQGWTASTISQSLIHIHPGRKYAGEVNLQKK